MIPAKLTKNKGILFSGIIAAITIGMVMENSFIYILINVIPIMVLYMSLAYIYRKNNTNIWFSISTYMLYTLFASSLLERIM